MLIGLFFLGNASSAWAEDFASLVFTPVDATQGLSGNQVRNIAQLPDGRMLITTEGQLNLYDGTGFTYLHYGGSQICSLSAYGGYHHAYIDAHGYIWMKNQHTLMAVDLSHERMLQRPDSLLASWGVREPLKDFFMDEGRNLWIVTGSDRLMRTDSRTLQSSVVLSQVSSLSALGSADLLLDLCVKDNRLYLFYRSGSLLCYDLSTRALSYRRALSGTLPDSYGSTSYVVPTADGFHQLCNGRGGGVMLHYSYQERAWEVVLHTSYWLNHLSVDRQGRIWVSCREGLWCVSSDFRQKQFIPVLKLVDGRKIETEVCTLYHDDQGGLWAGTLNRGVLYYHPARFRFQQFGRALFPLKDEVPLQVTGFVETADRQLEVETDQGVFLYRPEEGGTLRLVSADHRRAAMRRVGNEDVLQQAAWGTDSVVGITRRGWFIGHKQDKSPVVHASLHSCHALATDGKSRVWIGLEDGLLLWNPSTGRQRMFYTTDGLVNNSVRSLIRTPDGALWISTANGISCLTVRTGADGQDSLYTFINYNQWDGVLADEFCRRSVCLASDGALYWGGINGFNRLLPSRRFPERPASAPLFVGLNLHGRPVECGKAYEGRVLLRRPLSQTHSLTLAHHQNFFTLEFSGLNYINPTQTYYRYQLVGIDEEEQEMRSSDGRGYAAYTGLPPGSYRFRVRAMGNGETWSDRYAELLITIEAPFWQTPYAYACYVLLAVVACYLSLTTYLRHKRRGLVREQKEELDRLKGVFLQNINRELQTPVERMLPPLDKVLEMFGEGRVRRELQEVRQEAVALKDLVGQLSEGVLLPLPADEKDLDFDALLLDMRRLLEQQERRKERDRQEAPAEEALLSTTDEDFLRKALAFVERNIDNPDYTVEAWSRDLGMDRTGLYRKLVAMVGKTPVNVIRSVRLKRAAQLLDEGYTVAEVADRVGFSTASYLSKCFQEEFGVRPSQYGKSL